MDLTFGAKKLYFGALKLVFGASVEPPSGESLPMGRWHPEDVRDERQEAWERRREERQGSLDVPAAGAESAEIVPQPAKKRAILRLPVKTVSIDTNNLAKIVAQMEDDDEVAFILLGA